MQAVGEHPLAALSAWLADTALSQLLQRVEWLVPAIQTVHILAVALVISSVLLVSLGVFGLHGREQPLARTVARFVPGIRWGVPVLLVSGALMITAEPDRALPNPAFQLKMALLVVAATLTWASTHRLRTAPAVPAPGSAAGLGLRIATATALGLWLAVLVAGRWIAYTLAR
jgi:hypothetical protein